jgi:hypothetical protein
MYSIKFITKNPGGNCPYGMFRAQLMQGTRVIETKDGSLSVHSPEDAYQLLVNTSAKWVQTYSVTSFDKPTFRELSNSFLEKVRGKESISDIFGHAGKFKACIRASHKEQGHAKVKEMLEEGLTLLEELHLPLMKKQQAEADANIAMAWTLYRISLSSGIDMQDKCIDANVKRLYLSHFDSNGKAKTYYVLEGERWDGLGNPPTSFKKWAAHTGEKSYDELLMKGCDHG